MIKSVRLIENFLSWQGEGPDTGKLMLILRFKRCNRCCPWCDTQVKMRISNEAEYPLRDIQTIVDEHNCGLMITGGEPTFGHNFNQTVSLINEINAPFYNVETNGFDLLKLIGKVHPDKNVRFMLSPKIFTVSKVGDEKDDDFYFYVGLTKKVIKNDNVFIKLACEDRPLVHDYLNFLKEIKFPNLRVFLMPQGKTREELLSKPNAAIVTDLAEKYDFCISGRMHIVSDFT